MGLQLLPPDINESDVGFTPVENTVRYGLTAIKGMGTNSVLAIIAARTNGKFTSLFDFCGRLESGAVNRRGLESLIAAGAFDSLKPDGLNIGAWRARNHAAIDLALQQGQRVAEDKMRGQSGLFAVGESVSLIDEDLPVVASWLQSEVASREKAAVGFYLSTHPLDDHKDLLDTMRLKNIAEYNDAQSGQNIKIAGMIGSLQIRTSKRGNRFAQCRIEDRSGSIKGLLIGENFNKLISSIGDGELFIVGGSVEAAEGQEPTLRISGLESLREAETRNARELHITVPRMNGSTEAFLEELLLLFDRNKGGCRVFFQLRTGDVDVTLGSDGVLVQGSCSLQDDLEARGCLITWIH